MTENIEKLLFLKIVKIYFFNYIYGKEWKKVLKKIFTILTFFTFWISSVLVIKNKDKDSKEDFSEIFYKCSCSFNMTLEESIKCNYYFKKYKDKLKYIDKKECTN